jgi:hypothetical protein
MKSIRKKRSNKLKINKINSVLIIRRKKTKKTVFRSEALWRERLSSWLNDLKNNIVLFFKA